MKSELTFTSVLSVVVGDVFLVVLVANGVVAVIFKYTHNPHIVI